MAPRIHVGCPMWAHKAWVGQFLPAGIGPHQQLAAYASWCDAVEGNTTFYAVPPPHTVESWSAQAPPGFRFSFKLPRTITHERRLRNADEELRAFLAAIAPLEDRLAPTSIQLPASIGVDDLGVLAGFLRTLPVDRRWAVEVRSRDFFEPRGSETLNRLLQSWNVERIVMDTRPLYSAPPTSDAEREAWGQKPRLPVEELALTDTPVVRYVGRDDVAATVAGWQTWVSTFVRWVGEGREPTFFVHTPDNFLGLELAREFHAYVAAAVPDLQPLPQPWPTDETEQPKLF